MDDNKSSGIEHVENQGKQVAMEQFDYKHFLHNSNSKPQEQPLNESFKPRHASINPKPKDSKDDTKK